MRIPVAVLVPPAMALALSATCAYAHDPAVAAPAGEPPATTNATSTTAAALTVVRDKDTGRLRKATAEEMQAMLANARASAAARPVAEPRDVKGRNGASGLFLGEAAMSTQVARRNAKGGLDETCVVGDEAVDRFVKAKPTQRGASHE